MSKPVQPPYACDCQNRTQPQGDEKCLDSASSGSSSDTFGKPPWGLSSLELLCENHLHVRSDRATTIRQSCPSSNRHRSDIHHSPARIDKIHGRLVPSHPHRRLVPFHLAVPNRDLRAAKVKNTSLGDWGREFKSPAHTNDINELHSEARVRKPKRTHLGRSQTRAVTFSGVLA